MGIPFATGGNPGCCGQGSGGGGPITGEITIEENTQEFVQCSHDFTGAVIINAAALLAQSGAGSTSVHSVDIDIRPGLNAAGALQLPLAGPNVNQLGSGDSISFKGEVDNNIFHPVTDFELAIGVDTIARISWTEIV